MAVSYTCPNPDCGVTLKTPSRVAAGKSVKCPKCGKPFVPETDDEPAAAGPGTFKLADEPAGPKKPGASARPTKTEPAKSDPAKAREDAKKAAADDEDDEESVKAGYGVVKETEAELEAAEKNKPKFTEIQDKFKKSARGPAQSLLVMPSNLLTFEGLVTVAAGILIFVVGMWPLVFNDAPPGDEEMEEAIITMMLGMLAFVWGALICFGASQMQELGSYSWAMAGSVMGVLPILVGIFGIIMLLNPKVKAGFEEAEGGPDDEDEDEDDDDDNDKDEDEDEDEDEEDEEEDKKPKKKAKARTKKPKDDEDEDEEDEKPRKKKSKAGKRKDEED